MATNAHKKIVGLDVAMNKILIVNKFNARYHLIGEHEHRFHGESSRAKVKEILQAWTEQVHDKYVVVFFLAVPAYVRYADAALQYFIQFTLVQELRMARFY